MTGPPRNRKGFERGQRLRAEIRAMLEAHSPLAPPLSGKEIQARLTSFGYKLELRTVQWHVQQIRCAQRNLSNPPVAA